MGNTPEEKKPEELLMIKSLTLNYQRTLSKNDKSERNKKDFNKFKNYMLKFEYYKKILKLGCRKNPVLKLLYYPEGSFNSYNQQMFYFLEDIPYVNYNDCLKLLEIRYSQTHFEKMPNKENSPNNKKEIAFDLNDINDEEKKQKKGDSLLKKSSFKISNKANVKKTATFDLSKNEQFNISTKKNILSKEKEEQPIKIKTFNDGLLELFEKIYLYDPKKIQKILLIYPINNMRWILWLSIAKVKYKEINKKMNVSNKEIYDYLTTHIDFNDDSLLFELHNTLKELKVYKYNWSNSLYRIIKGLTAYEQNMRYETGMNILLGVPLIISDCNEEETFFFGRYLLSISYGLGLYYFYDENEFLLDYLVFIFHSLAKERYPKIYEKLSEFNISDELWVKKWMKTFFSSIFDLSITIRVWDCVIAVGIRFLVNYALAILEFHQDKIMSFKKVKEFLEYFDYELRKKYKKDKEIISFRENIISLAQSYYIPDGKFELIEKEYLELLFKDKDKSSGLSFQFDTSRTVNNYYSNNASLTDEQYHIKLILRTLVYIPNEFIINNVEEQNILAYQNKREKRIRKKSKSFAFSKNKDGIIIENEPNDEEKNNEKGNEEKKDKEKESKDTYKIDDIRLYSSLEVSPEKKKEVNSQPSGLNIKKLLSKESNEMKTREKVNNKEKNDDLIDTSENKKTDNNIEEQKKSGLIDNTKDKKEDKKDNSSNEEDDEFDDGTFDFTFNDEQIPTS